MNQILRHPRPYSASKSEKASRNTGFGILVDLLLPFDMSVIAKGSNQLVPNQTENQASIDRESSIKAQCKTELRETG